MRAGATFGFCILLALTGCSSSRRPGDAGAPDGAAAGGALDDGGTAASGSRAGGGGKGASGPGSTDGGIVLPDGAVVLPDGATAGSGGAIGTTDPNFTVPESLQLCDGPCACADGMDNDGDGMADGFDTECTGPADNDEGSFATGIPGDNVDPKWQDCFFDGNSGGGDDGCRYSTKCLTGDLPQDDKDCTQSQACVDFCKPRAPNGCDCFGCCEVFKADGTSVHVVLTSSCDEADLDACQTCTPSADCNNECGECELCPGKTIADLPASCGNTPGGSGGSGGGGTSGGAGSSSTAGKGGSGDTPPPPPTYTCDSGETVCTSTADCVEGQYCAFGCCRIYPGPD